MAGLVDHYGSQVGTQRVCMKGGVSRGGAGGGTREGQGGNTKRMGVVTPLQPADVLTRARVLLTVSVRTAGSFLLVDRQPAARWHEREK